MFNPADLAELDRERQRDPSDRTVPPWWLRAPLGAEHCRASATCRQCRHRAVLTAVTVKALDAALAAWRCPACNGPAF